MILYNYEEKFLEIPTGIAPNINTDDIINSQVISRTLTENGSYSFGPDEDHNALAGVSINVDVHPITQRKVVDSSTAPQLVTPDEGADALSEVLVNPYTINTVPVVVDSSTVQQVVYPTEGIDGFNQVTVRPYRLSSDRIFNPDVISRTYQISAPFVGWNKITINAVGPWIDSNIQEQYIKKGVSILGVTGTLETDCPPCPDYVSQIKTINMGKVQQTVTPDASYDGLSKVIVNPYQITNQVKNVDSSINEVTVTPDSSYDGLSKVIINPYVINNQVKTVDSSINDFTVTPDSLYDGLSKVIINGFADKLQTKTANSSKTAQVVTPDSSYQGLSRVIINPYNINNQTKVISASKGTEVVVPDASYDGLGRVVIQPYQIKLQDKTVDTQIAEQVIIPDASYDGLSRVIVNAPKIESKNLYITQNGTYVTMPTLGYDGMGRVVARVNIPAPIYQTKYADSSTEIQYITPDDGYAAISKMVINPYRLQAKSVTPGKQTIQVRPDGTCDGLSVVTVLGIQDHLAKIVLDSSTQLQHLVANGETCYGWEEITVKPYALQEKTVSPKKSTFTVYPSNGYDGLSKVTIIGYDNDLYSAVVDSSVDDVHYYPEDFGDYPGFSDFLVRGYAAELKLVSGIADVSTEGKVYYPAELGDYNGFSHFEVLPMKLESKTVDSSENTVTYLPETGNHGFSDFTVNGVPLEDLHITIQDEDMVYTPEAPTMGFKNVYVPGYDTLLYPYYEFEPVLNGTTITPPEGYFGFKSFRQNSIVPYLDTLYVELKSDPQTIGPNTGKFGYSEVVVPGLYESLMTRTVRPSEQSVTYTPSFGFIGFSEFTVDGMNLQSKTVTPGLEPQVITADLGYDALKQVTVGPGIIPEYETLERTITANGRYTFIPATDDISYNKVIIDVSVSGGGGDCNLETQVRYGIDSSTVLTPGTGYDGIFEAHLASFGIYGTKDASIDPGEPGTTETFHITPYLDDASTGDSIYATDLHITWPDSSVHAYDSSGNEVPVQDVLLCGYNINHWYSGTVSCCPALPGDHRYFGTYPWSESPLSDPTSVSYDPTYNPWELYQNQCEEILQLDAEHQVLPDANCCCPNIYLPAGSYTVELASEDMAVNGVGPAGELYVDFAKESNKIKGVYHHTYEGVEWDRLPTYAFRTWTCFLGAAGGPLQEGKDPCRRCGVNGILAQLPYYRRPSVGNGTFRHTDLSYDNIDMIVNGNVGVAAFMDCNYGAQYPVNDASINAVIAHKDTILYGPDPLNFDEGEEIHTYEADGTIFLDPELVGHSGFRRCNAKLAFWKSPIDDNNMSEHQYGDYSFFGANIVYVDPDWRLGIEESLPEPYYRFNTSHVGAHAFDGQSSIMLFTIVYNTMGVTIGDYAYANMEHYPDQDGLFGLQNDIHTEHWTSAGEYVFSGTDQVRTIYLDNTGYCNFHTETFNGIPNLRIVNVKGDYYGKNLTFRNSGFEDGRGITVNTAAGASLSSEMFAYTNTKHVYLNNVTIIPYKCFDGCPLNTVDLGSSNHILEEAAFMNTGLYSTRYDVDVDNHILSIGNGCYSGAYLSSLRWTNNALTEVPDACFYEMRCRNVTWADFSTTRKWGITAFAGHHEFTRIEIPDGVEELEYRACSGSWGESAVEYVRIPSTLKIYSAFIGEMPNITRIDSYLTDPDYIGPGGIVSGTSGLPYDIKRNGVLHVRNISVNTGTQADPVMTPVIDIYRAQWFDDPDDVTKLAYYGWTIVNDLP